VPADFRSQSINRTITATKNIILSVSYLEQWIEMSTTNAPETTKAVVSDSKDDSKPLQPQKPAAPLEEDDEFEDFPVEGRLDSGNGLGES
jgi:hypothetical protein